MRVSETCGTCYELVSSTIWCQGWNLDRQAWPQAPFPLSHLTSPLFFFFFFQKKGQKLVLSMCICVYEKGAHPVLLGVETGVYISVFLYCPSPTPNPPPIEFLCVGSALLELAL